MTTDWDTVAEMAAEDRQVRREHRAAGNQAYVRRLLAARQPAFAATLELAVAVADRTTTPHVCRRDPACTW